MPTIYHHVVLNDSYKITEAKGGINQILDKIAFNSYVLTMANKLTFDALMLAGNRGSH